MIRSLRLKKNRISKKNILSGKKNLSLYLLIMPAVIYVILLHYMPIFGLFIAFKDYNSYQGIFGSPWAGMMGFEHFITFIKLPNFWLIMRNTLILSVYSIVLNTVLPIILALFINEIRSKIFKKNGADDLLCTIFYFDCSRSRHVVFLLRCGKRHPKFHRCYIRHRGD